MAVFGRLCWYLIVLAINHLLLVTSFVVDSPLKERNIPKKLKRHSKGHLIAFRVASSFQDSSSRLSLTAQVDIASYSIDGVDPNRPSKVNQDAFFQDTFGEKCRYTCVGVMDGHGLKGHLLTSYLKEQLPLRVQQLVESNGNLELDQELKEALQLFEAQLVEMGKAPPVETKNHNNMSSKAHQLLLTRAFHLVHVDAMQNPNVPAGRTAGTTCIVALLDTCKNKLYLAHVGDSRAIILAIRKDDNNKNKPLELVAITTETTTTNLSEERRRVEQCDGRIDGQGNVFYGPVGIAMTRALGDSVMLRAGVLPTPLVEECALEKDTDYRLVLATDGIWDVLTNQDVVSILDQQQHDTVQAFAKEIAETARRKWIGDLPIAEDKVDDITCVVLRIDARTNDS